MSDNYDEVSIEPLLHECGGYWGQTLMGSFKCSGCDEHKHRDDEYFAQFRDTKMLITVLAVQHDLGTERWLAEMERREAERAKCKCTSQESCTHHEI